MGTWEQTLHRRLVHDVVVRTNSIERYQTDARFHAQMDMLVSIVIATICDHDPLSEDMRHRAEDLGRIFRDEIDEWQRGRR